MNHNISNALKDLGISPSLLGYTYLRDAIQLVMEDARLVHAITKELYPIVAKRNNTTPTRAERAMRHAIETGWIKGSVTVQNAMFGRTVSCERGKPTNSEFIATVADYLKTTTEEKLV